MIALVVHSCPAYAVLQNDVTDINGIKVDKSNAPNGFIIENAEQIGTGVNGGLILFDNTNKIYRSIVNDNGTLMINIDANGTLKRILTEDDLGAGSNGNLQDPEINGLALFKDNSIAQFNGQILIPAGAGDGYILTSDVNGYASWEPLPISGANGNGMTFWSRSATDIIHPFNGTTDNVVVGGTNLGNSDIILDKNGGAIFNDQGLNGSDFRVESNNNEYAIYVQSGSDRVGIGSSSPASLLDVGNGSVDFIDGDNDVLIGDDLEVDGTAFANNFNGINANLTNVSATQITATQFNGGNFFGVFNGSFIGDGSGLAGVAQNNGSITNLTVFNGFLQDPVINGAALFRNGGTVVFNGDIFIPGGANNGWILTSDDNGRVSWQPAAAGGGSADDLGSHIASQDLDMNGFNLINTAGLVVNENGDIGSDFRVESNGDEYLIYAQAGSDSVGIGTSSPSALLDIANGTLDQAGVELLVGGNAEIDGTIFADNFNGLAANITTIDASTINAVSINGGIFNGSFVGDGSGLTGINVNGDGLGNHKASQDLDLNGFALVNGASIAFESLVVNDNGDAGNEFRVEGNGDEYLIFAQANTDSVGIGTASPSALLDVGNGSVDFIDGDNDVLIGDDLEVDGTAFADNFNGLAANITTINSTTINAANFNGGVFNGTFVGDGSGITGAIGEWTQTSGYLHPIDSSGSKTILVGGTAIGPAGADTILYANGGAVFNDNSFPNQDFRVESGSSAAALFVDSSLDRVGILDTSPNASLSVGAGAGVPTNIDGANDLFVTDSIEALTNIYSTRQYASEIFASSFVNGTTLYSVTANAQTGNIGTINSTTISNTGTITSNAVNSATVTATGTVTGATVNATTMNASNFIGGSFNGAFFGDGSGLTNITVNGDDLGDHTATENLNMDGFAIVNASLAVTDALIVNQNGDLGNDFRVESNGDEYLIYAQANTDSVGIGTASPAALLDVGNGQLDFIDGDNDVIIADDLEVDGTIFSDNFNGLNLNVTNAFATTFNGTFVGDGSGLDGVAVNNGSVNNLTIFNGTLIDSEINGETLFVNGSTTIFNGDLYIPDGANGGFVLTSDNNGKVSWQPATATSCNAELVLTPRSLSPVNGATGVAIDSNLEIVFNGLLLSGDGSVRINNVDTNSLAFDIEAGSSNLSIMANKVVINPPVDLDYNTNYAVQVDADAFQNAAGCSEFWAGFNDNASFAFQTVIAPTLSVASRFPTNGENGVAQDADFSISFNNPIVNPPTSQAESFEIRRVSNGGLFRAYDVASASLSNGNTTLSFANSNDMIYGEEYYIIINGGLIQNSFNPPGDTFAGFANNTDWRFRVEAAPVVNVSGLEITLPTTNGETTTTLVPLDIDSTGTSLTQVTLRSSTIAGNSDTVITFDTVTGLPNAITKLFGNSVSISFNDDVDPATPAVPDSFADRYVVPSQEYSLYVSGGTLYLRNELDGFGIYNAKVITIDYRNF